MSSPEKNKKTEQTQQLPAQAPAAPKGYGLLFSLMFLTWGTVIAGVGYIALNRAELLNPTNALHQRDDAHIQLVTSLQTQLQTLENQTRELTERNRQLEDRTAALDAIPDSDTLQTPEQAEPPATITKPPAANEAVPQDGTVKTTPLAADQPAPEITPEQTATSETQYKPVNEPEGSFEYMAFEKEAFDAGLSEVSDRTVALEEKLFELQQKLEHNTVEQNTSQLIIAAVNLRDAVNNTRSFEHELEMLNLYSNEDPFIRQHVSVLETYSRLGVSNLSSLNEDFNDMADRILNLFRQKKEAPSLLDKAALHFSHFISVRKIGEENNGTDADDIVARAEADLHNHQLQSAIYELQQLDESLRPLVQAWISRANAMLESQEASDAILKYVTRLSRKAEYNSPTETAL